jgi:uncharacterized protein YbjT (DUF2867 family)
MKAFVAGATGRTGRRIVEQLVQREIPVRALVRDREKAAEMLPPQAELVVGDVSNPAQLAEAIADATVLLCATGAKPSLDPLGPFNVDYVGTRHLIEAAKAKNIQHFVFVSSLCVSQFFHPLNLFWLVLYWKKQAEKDLIQSGLTYTIVRPGGLLDTDNEDVIVMQGADTLFEGRIPRSKVAQVSIEALFDSATHNTIAEIVARPDAPEKPFSELFASVGTTSNAVVDSSV